MRIIPAATLPVSRWSNGAGRKADILTGDGWMVGLAWLDQDAPFSRLTAIDRTITLVEGPGFTLDIDGASLPVPTLFVPTRFDGGAPTYCRITGPSRVLNAMTNRAYLSHSVTILDRSGRVDPEGSLACVLVALQGTVLDGALGVLDAAKLDAPADVVLAPGSRAALIKIADAR